MPPISNNTPPSPNVPTPSHLDAKMSMIRPNYEKTLLCLYTVPRQFRRIVQGNLVKMLFTQSGTFFTMLECSLIPLTTNGILSTASGRAIFGRQEQTADSRRQTAAELLSRRLHLLPSAVCRLPSLVRPPLSFPWIRHR